MLDFLYTKIEKRGFTLVEILIVIATLTLLFGIGYANFRDFQRRQQVEMAKRTVIADLRLAQESALSGKKPSLSVSECEILNYYTFERVDTNTYQIRVNCSGSFTLVKKVDLQGIIIESFLTIWFYPLGKGTNIDPGSYRIITLKHVNFPNISRTITVTSGGSIY